MNRNEQEFINRIDKAAENIKVPESLEPKNIEKQLANRPKKFRWRKSYTAGLAAACCLVVCGIVYGTAGQSIGGNSSATADSSAAGSGREGSSGETGFQTADSYEDIFSYLETYMNPQEDTGFSGGTSGAVATEETASAEDMASDSSSSQMKTMESAEAGMVSADYSETNVRQEGVDEADVVKTDGRYLYALWDNGRGVSIVDTADGALEKVSEIELEEEYTVSEFYVNGGKLVMVGDVYKKNLYELLGGENVSAENEYVLSNNTFAVTYDLTDPAEPKKAGEVTQSGSYSSSRMADGHLYLFSRYYVDRGNYTREEIQYYIPIVNNELMPKNNIYLPYTEIAYNYEVICSVDMENPQEVQDSKAIFSNFGSLYVSNGNIYWYEEQWDDGVCTSIRKIAYEAGELRAVASGMVDGYIHDSFCIDEYDGYLRVITTEDDTNSVYVLNGELEMTGSITGLAEEERVYSARLLGEVGYFVTYRETDPLFSVDFSDPKEPKILGELKIPGFSEYLHFYGENQLLDIGMDTDEDGFTTNGVKLSMFDISDNTDVKEVQKYVMDNVYSADILYDYRAALIDVGKNIIGFSAYDGNGESYYVFTYDDDKGFECVMEETVNGNSYQSARGVYIDSLLYIVKGNIIESYSMEDYQKVDDIIL